MLGLHVSTTGRQLLSRAYLFNEAISTLEKIEADTGLWGSTSQPFRYLFAESRNRATLASLPQRFLSSRAWAKLLLQRHHPISPMLPVGRSTSRAETLLLKSNALAFYPADRLVCKFWRGNGGRSRDSLINEAAGAQLVSNFDVVKVPRIIDDSSQNACVPFVWYEQVNGFAPKRGQTVAAADLLMGKLLLLYERYGINAMPVRHLLPCVRQDKLSGAGWSEGEADLLTQTVEALAASEKIIPFSFTHGDPSPGNMLLTPGGEIIVLDWELSGVRSIVSDVLKLSHHSPHVMTIYSEWLAKQPTAFASAGEQADLAILSSYLHTLSSPMKVELTDSLAEEEVGDRDLIMSTVGRLRRSQRVDGVFNARYTASLR